MKAFRVLPLCAVAAFAAAAAGPDAVSDDGESDAPSVRNFATQAGQAMSRIRLPISRHPGNGRVKELLTADRATVDDAGIVRVDGRIQLFEFDETGATNGFAVGLGGFFDPVHNYAECHGPVAFVRPGVVLAGTNLTWNAKTSVLRIETNAILRIQRDGRSVVDAFDRQTPNPSVPVLP